MTALKIFIRFFFGDPVLTANQWRKKVLVAVHARGRTEGQTQDYREFGWLTDFN